MLRVFLVLYLIVFQSFAQDYSQFDESLKGIESDFFGTHSKDWANFSENFRSTIEVFENQAKQSLRILNQGGGLVKHEQLLELRDELNWRLKEGRCQQGEIKALFQLYLNEIWKNCFPNEETYTCVKRLHRESGKQYNFEGRYLRIKNATETIDFIIRLRKTNLENLMLKYKNPLRL